MSWESSYRARSTPWLRPHVNPAFGLWFDQSMIAGARILVPGCGTSKEPLEFARLGGVVTAIDLSPTAVQYQETCFAEAGMSAALITTDLFDWHYKSEFDIAYEQTCLCAIEPTLRSAYELVIRTALKPLATLFALFMQTGGNGGPPYHCSVDDMRELFGPDHWSWRTDHPLVSQHPLGLHELGFILTRLP